MLIANKLVYPSYISLELVFALHNLIPEGVFEITAITSKKTQRFESEIANFNYRHLKPTLIFGYYLHDTEFGKVNIAFLEKALLDFLYLMPEADNLNFFYELRFDKNELNAKIDREKLFCYLKIFDKRKLTQRTMRFLDYVTN
ncbi:MAG: hypothetical protein KIT27_06665 [Legionellales bacterium]|nr:hypothetical protein [Legionellales bacterium]